MKHKFRLFLMILIGALTACAQGSSPTTQPEYLPPTLHPILGLPERTPTSKPLETPIDLPAPSQSTLVPTPILLQTKVITITLYDDQLNPGWELLDREGMTSDLSSTKYVHSGKYAIEMTPSQDFSELYFAVQKEADPLPQNQVISISFWLNGGFDFIAPEEIWLLPL